MDAQIYDSWAQSIADGHWLRERAFYQSPLFPYVLGLLYSLFGHHLLMVGLFNAFLGALTATLLGVITFEAFGQNAAACTGILAAFYRPLIFYTGPVMKEPLALFLLALCFLFVLRGLHQNRTKHFILAGLLLGLGALVRGNMLFLAPAVLGLGFYLKRKDFARNAAVFLASILLAIAPATIHNALASRDFVLINYADGFNLYIGNSPTANGVNAYPPEVSTDPYQEELMTGWVAKDQSKRDLSPSEVSAYWRDLALSYMLDNPWQDLMLLKNKCLAFWNNHEAFDNYDVMFIRKNFDTLLNWPLADFWLLSSLAAFAAVALWRNKKKTITIFACLSGSYIASVLLFYVTDRYRLPIVIFLLPLAGAACPTATQILCEQKARQLGPPVLGATVALILAFLPAPEAVDLTAFDWGTLAIVYSDQGKDADALDALKKGIAYSPLDVGSQAYVRGALAEQNLGHMEAAEQYLLTAMRDYPGDGIVMYNYARLKAAQGNMERAFQAMKDAIAMSPSYTLSYYGLALLYDHQGDHAEALSSIKRGLTIDPADQRLQEALTKAEQK